MTQVLASRRIIFHGLGALGVAVALAGCGGGDSAGGASDQTATPEGTDPATSDPATDSTSSSAADPESADPTSAPATAGLVAVADVPVGGGVVLPDDNLVVVQPTEGEFKAYTATCTHTGTQVNEVDGTDIVCPNHGSRFSIEDGSAVQGPASAPLTEVPVSVDGDMVVAA